MKSWWRIMLGIGFACIGIGIVFGMFGFAISRGQAAEYRDNSFRFSDTVEGVTSIDLDVNFSKIEIMTGNEFTVEVRNMAKDGFVSYVENGIWHLEDDYDKENSINLFGFQIPVNWNLGFNYADAPSILVTIPDDFRAENFDLMVGAGELTMEELNAINCDIIVGAGSMKVQQLNATNTATLEVGAGELVVSNLETLHADFNCGFGSMRVQGLVLGDLSADCGMGEIQMDLIGDEDAYNYYINCGLGNVGINNDNFSFIASRTIRNENAIGSFDLNCGMGSIDVEIRQ